MADGSVSKKQKFYQNVTNPPLLTGDAGKLVLEILGVPELHLLIGMEDQNFGACLFINFFPILFPSL